MSLLTLADAIITQLVAGGAKNPHLADFEARPTGPYTRVYSDPGFAYANGYDGKSNRVSVRWQIISVTNSRRGVLDMVGDVRNALTDFSPGGTPESGRLSEEFAGPVFEIEDAPLDVRFSLTLNYVMTTHRGEV